MTQEILNAAFRFLHDPAIAVCALIRAIASNKAITVTTIGDTAPAMDVLTRVSAHGTLLKFTLGA